MIELEGRLIKDIHSDLVRELGGMVDEYFSIDCGVRAHGLRSGAFWPTDVKWIACYAVTGGTEGWYWHVDIIRSDGSRDMVFLGKTFISMEHAQNCVAKCAELLGA